jgi:shikimate dehydrogenase
MKLYGLIGYPLGHSFSKQYFTEKFLREGLPDCYFEAFPISSIDQFPGLLQQNKELMGLGVTIPYKEQVLRFVTELSDEVKYIGAANCIKVAAEKTIAYNTDIIGFRDSFCKLLQPKHKKALILGTGGASKAVQYVLKKSHFDYTVVTRTENNRAGYIPYKMIDKQVMKEHLVVINCTPLGTWPNTDTCPDIPYHLVTLNHYFYDLVYKPEKTLFLQQAEQKGAIIKNGFEMLIIQSEANWNIWNS